MLCRVSKEKENERSWDECKEKTKQKSLPILSLSEKYLTGKLKPYFLKARAIRFP